MKGIYHSLLEQSLFDVALMQYGSLDGGVQRLFEDNPELVQAGGVVSMFGSVYKVRKGSPSDARMREEMQRIVPVTEGGIDNLAVWVNPAYAPWVTPQAQYYAAPDYSGVSGVRPDQFTEELNPTDANFEVYSQKGGQTRRTKLSRVGPGIAEVQYVPVTTGNQANLNTVVVDPNDAVWFIAGNGAAVKLSGGAAQSTNEVREQKWVAGYGFTCTAALPQTDVHARLKIYRNGVKLVFGLAFTLNYATNAVELNTSYPAADNELFEVFIST
jgi:hypothetical protein